MIISGEAGAQAVAGSTSLMSTTYAKFSTSLACQKFEK